MSRTLQTLALAVVFALGVLVGASVLSTGTAQQAPPPPQAAWRYQLYLDQRSGSVWLLDTAVGRTWVNYGDDWKALKTPPGLENK